MTDRRADGLTFAWPWMLLALVAVPLVVLWYRRLLRARAARRAGWPRSAWSRRGAERPGGGDACRPRCCSVALALLLLALARPEATVPQPRREGTVILAFDVSASMAAKDLAPTRIDAAKAAARTFVAAAAADRAGRRRGVQRQRARHPGADHGPGEVLAAIDRLTPAGRHGARRAGCRPSLERDRRASRCWSTAGPATRVEPRGPDLGYHGSAAVVLLSDGENTTGPDPLDVADLASGAGREGLPDRARQAARARCSRSTASRSRPRWTSRLLREIAAAHRRHATSRRPTRRRWPRSTTRSTWSGRSPTEHVEVTALFAAAAAAAAARGRRAVARCGSGGRCSDGRPLAVRPPVPARCAAARRRVRVAAAGGGAGRRCGTPASR